MACLQRPPHEPDKLCKRKSLHRLGQRARCRWGQEVRATVFGMCCAASQSSEGINGGRRWPCHSGVCHGSCYLFGDPPSWVFAISSFERQRRPGRRPGCHKNELARGVCATRIHGSARCSWVVLRPTALRDRRCRGRILGQEVPESKARAVGVSLQPVLDARLGTRTCVGSGMAARGKRAWMSSMICFDELCIQPIPCA